MGGLPLCQQFLIVAAAETSPWTACRFHTSEGLPLWAASRVVVHF
jgi:hypothetical protein